MTYQIKAVGKLVNVVALKIRISGFRIRKNRKTGKLHMTYQIKALGKLVNVVKLEIRISGFWLGKNWKNRKNQKNLEKKSCDLSN